MSVGIASEEAPLLPSDIPDRPRRSTAASGVLLVLERYGLVVLFALIVIFFSFSPRTRATFPSVLNFRNLVGNQSVLAITALALILPLIAAHFDFSVGSVVGLSSIGTAAALSRFHAPLMVGVLVGVGIGALVGVVNGLLVAKVGINSFITTLGVATIIGGLIQWYTRGQSIIRDIPRSLTHQGSGLWFGIPRTLYFLIVIGFFVHYLLQHTPYGRYLHSVGSNASAARLVGLNVDRIVLLAFVSSGSLSGLAGVLQVARQGGGNPQIGPNFLLPALAAGFLGATAFRPGRFNVPGTILAVFFVAASVSGLTLSGVAPWVEPTFQGTALVVAVSISTVLARRRAGART